jgi:hypothetical protein
MQRTTYPLIAPPQGNLCSINWVMETPQLKAAALQQPDVGKRFLTSFATSALLGGLGELFEHTGLVSFDLSALAGASGGQLANLLTIANGWDPTRSFARSNANLFTPENKATPRGRSVGPFARALQATLHQCGHADARVYCEVMFHGTEAYRSWQRHGADDSYASGFDIIVVAGEAKRVVAIEVDEPCDIHHQQAYHATAEKKRKDDTKDADLARLGIPVLRLSEWQVWRQTDACVGLVLKLLATYAGLQLPADTFVDLNYRELKRRPRFTETSVREARVPRGWKPALALA